MKLATTYLGLKLRKPLVPSASPLSEKLDNIKRMEDAGAAAVVFHSPAERSVRAAICSILGRTPRWILATLSKRFDPQSFFCLRLK